MRLLLFILGALPAVLLGCAGSTGSPVVPIARPVPESHRQAAGSLTVLGESLLTVDLATLTATTEVVSDRSAMANDDVYVLDIAKFMRQDTFNVRQLVVAGDELAVTWRVTHPFPAPSDPEAAPSTTNRADLGFAGMVMFRAEEFLPASAYFTDVMLNTDLLTNADAYLRPAGLISGFSSFANTFPYQTIVDESGPDGSRVGISNGGVVTGNFGINGWTRTDLGTDRTGWTGYGVLHQGQVSERVARFSISHFLAPGRLSLRVNLLAKYNDPKGIGESAQLFANRLPFKPAEPLRFGYRMPHGALDVERVIVHPESGGFVANQQSSSILQFHVIDWDARAEETQKTSLSLDRDLTTVAFQESGCPQLAVCIPGLLGDESTVDVWDPSTGRDDDTARDGDALPDSGRPGDPLFYTKQIYKSDTVNQVPGEYTGLVRVQDPEPFATLTPLDGDSLQPLTTNLPVNKVYQPFHVTVSAGEPGWARGYGMQQVDNVEAMVVAPTGDIYIGGNFVGFSDFGGGYLPAFGETDGFLLKLNSQGAYQWTRVLHGATNELVTDLSMTPSGDVAACGWFGYVMNFGGTTLMTAPLTSLDLFVAVYSPSNELRWVRAGTNTGFRDYAYSVDVDPAGNVFAAGLTAGRLDLGSGQDPYRSDHGWIGKWSDTGTLLWDQRMVDVDGGYVTSISASGSGYLAVLGEAKLLTLGGERLCTLGGRDTYLAMYSPTGGLTWATSWGSSGTDASYEIVTDRSSGAVYASSHYDADLIWEGQTYPPYDPGGSCVVQYSAGGEPGWIYLTRTSRTEIDEMTVTPTGSLTIGGRFLGDDDFGGGLRQYSDYEDDAFLTLLSADGEWAWDATFPGIGLQEIGGIGITPDNDVVACGNFEGTVDFDPGLGLFPLGLPGNNQNIFVMRLQGPTGRF